MALFEKHYIYDEFLSYAAAKCSSINFIYFHSDEERADSNQHICDLEKITTVYSYELEYNYLEDCIIYEDEKLDLLIGLKALLEKIDSSIPLLINITSLNIRPLGSLLVHLKKLQFEIVYCLYTEPLFYSLKEQIPENPNDYLRDQFDLYQSFRGVLPIPGMLRENDECLDEKWIVFLGFDGKRPTQIYEQYEFSDINPIITLPGFKPGWHNYSINENLDFLKTLFKKPEYISARSYLDSYHYLERIAASNPNCYLRISPFGTKINALGVLIFVINHARNVEVLYDNPNVEGKYSEETGITHVFDISEPLSLPIVP